MVQGSKSAERAPDQSSLNSFVGTKDSRPHQRTLSFSIAPPRPRTDPDRAMAPPVIKSDSEDDVPQQAPAKPAKRVAPPTANSDGEDKPQASLAKRPKTQAEGDKTSPEKRATAASSSTANKPSTSSASSSTDKPKPPVSSFFAPRSTKPAAAAFTAVKPGDKGKGKAPAKDDADEEDDDGDAPMKRAEKDASESPSGAEGDEADEDEEEDDEADKEEQKKAAVKIADIFSKSSKPDKAQTSWKAGEPVPYAALTATFSKIDATTKRLEISAYLTHFLVEVIEKTPEDLLKSVYLCINRLAPEYESLELGIGESLLMKAIGESCGRSLAQVKAEYKKIGDLGEVAFNSRTRQKTLFKSKPLTVRQVFDELKKVAKTSGDKSQARKVGLIKALLAKCEGEETKFLIRSLEGKLRIGLAEKTALVSLAHAVVTAEHAKSGKKWSRERLSSELETGAEIVKSVFSEIPSYDLVVPALLDNGIAHLQEACQLTPGIPLKPMLAKPTKAISEVLDRFEGKHFTCEYKYDGERAQIHFLEDGSVRVFSRNSEDMTVKYPEFVTQLPRAIKPHTKSFVIDAEAVAWDTEERRLLEFQKLSTRKRKDVKAEDIKVKVHLFAFDLLYLNGEALLEKNLRERRALLREHLQAVDGEFAFAQSEDASTVDEIQAFLDRSIKDGCEGLMVKMLEGEGASYEPSRRSIHWLKLKKDYLQGVGDSFDLVVIGGDYGKGKRTNVYGAFHLACYDPDSGTYQMICKIGTGFSDEALKTHWETLKPLELAQKKAYYDVGGAKGPDVYFEPKVVWEVLAADLSLSPIYSAAKGLCGDRGISLRFPRFLRIRDDKDAEQSTEPEQIAEAYRRQAIQSGGGGKKRKGGGGDDEGDFW
ncbi:DNA ligase [Rhodotorula diobovata]|uniref:DNA ligase n=1 Tax=Rhodotorula diobovata TaxID=5288 RepID=A0A5C5FMB9_9BASI|nr:DNA ligase [Rhodotorula diobovata]